MKRSGILLVLAAALVACGEETRNGQLSLAGSAPLRIADQEGKTVDFYSGPLKVVFKAESRSKVTVQLEQGERAARFSAKIPGSRDWNFSIKGSEIGQPVDLESQRSVALHGPVYERTGTGGPCGFDGNYITEERWQAGTEDWKVSFTDASTAQAVGSFASRKEDTYLIYSRNLWCRERRHHEPGRGGRWDRVSQKVGELTPKFD